MLRLSRGSNFAPRSFLSSALVLRSNTVRRKLTVDKIQGKGESYMTEYEMVTLFHPRLDEDGVTEISEWLQQRIAELGGENMEVQPWGRRSLAYPVEKQTEATYIQYDFSLEGSQMVSLTRAMQLNEDILRQLPIRKQDR